MKQNNDKRTGSEDVTNEGMPRYAQIMGGKYFKFGVVVVLYLLWTLWVGSWWLLLGVPVLFDMYVSKKVNWSFWKKRNAPNNRVVEWLDALIFAVIAVTLINIFVFQNYKIPTGSMEKSLQIGDHLYVSKLKYGPKLPNTPLSFPFVQNILPLTTSTKSYLEWIQWDYKRLKGFTHVKNDDNVVFNFPEGDTVLLQYPAESYYGLLRRHAENLEEYDKSSNKEVHPFNHYLNVARQQILSEKEYTVRPVDKCDNYIKRCIGIPGDTLKIVNAQVYINGNPQQKHENMQLRYIVQTDGAAINNKTLERLNIYKSDVRLLGNGVFSIPLIEANAELVRNLGNVISVEKILKPAGQYDSEIFPHDARYQWNVDNFGPLWIPKKGVTIKLNTDNICFYSRIITAYEHHTLNVTNGEIFINGEKTDSYTFKMDYYWMMGDNRHDSLDSRFWGFVPEDHIVGAPRVVWLALSKEKTFPFNIQFSRMFRWAGK
ncbi:MAG: S26 family signal peptidase [Bacteroidales bacterium]|jgi:signal peptidase I|nr:S26 family signal peptidase [Bacteroidales bacterium]